MPTADASVRPAVPGEGALFAAIQLATWEAAVPGALGDKGIGAIDAAEVEAGWEAAIVTPPTRQHRMFTATAGGTVVGFAAAAPTGELVALEVAPDHRRQGHGSRLLAAAVDHMRTRGVQQLRVWILDGDHAREAFYTSAGLAAGNAARTLEGPGGQVTERVWTASL